MAAKYIACSAPKTSSTILRSENFHVISPMRPPSPTTLKAARIPLRISPNSSFRWMRSAWKVIFAGCISWPDVSFPLARATSSANAFVVVGSALEAEACRRYLLKQQPPA